MNTGVGVVGYLAAIVVVTADYALFQAANNTAVMTDVRADQRGVMSGMLSLSRNLGLITGASAMGAVFAFASATTDLTTVHPEAVAAGMRATFTVAALLIVVALVVAMAGRGFSGAFRGQSRNAHLTSAERDERSQELRTAAPKLAQRRSPCATDKHVVEARFARNYSISIIDALLL